MGAPCVRDVWLSTANGLGTAECTAIWQKIAAAPRRGSTFFFPLDGGRDGCVQRLGRPGSDADVAGPQPQLVSVQAQVQPRQGVLRETLSCGCTAYQKQAGSSTSTSMAQGYLVCFNCEMFSGPLSLGGELFIDIVHDVIAVLGILQAGEWRLSRNVGSSGKLSLFVNFEGTQNF